MARSSLILDYVRSTVPTLAPEATHCRIAFKTAKSWGTWYKGTTDLLDLPELPNLDAHEKVAVRIQAYTEPSCTHEVDSAQKTFAREVEIVSEEALRVIAPASAEVREMSRTARHRATAVRDVEITRILHEEADSMRRQLADKDRLLMSVFAQVIASKDKLDARVLQLTEEVITARIENGRIEADKATDQAYAAAIKVAASKLGQVADGVRWWGVSKALGEDQRAALSLLAQSEGSGIMLRDMLIAAGATPAQRARLLEELLSAEEADSKTDSKTDKAAD